MVKPLAFFSRDVRIELSYPVAFTIRIVSIFFTVFFYFFLSRLIGDAATPYLEAYGGDYFAFVLIGLALQGYYSTGLQSFARNVREAQMTGTLEAMLLTPTRLSTIILSSGIFDYLFTTIQIVVAIVVGAALVGLSFQGANFKAALLVLLLNIIAFSGIGVIAASFITVLKRGDPVTWFFNSMATLLAGTFYPIEIMPIWLQWISHLIPLTYGVRAMRLALLAKASAHELLPDMLMLLAFCLVLVPLSLFIFRWAVNRARVDGSLTFY